MLETLKSWDESLFLWLNGFHSELMDSLMLLITHRLTWVPFYFILVVYLYNHIERNKVLVIVSIAVAVGLSDFVTSGLMKPFFMRLRPCHNPELTALIHVAGKCGGKFGYASSHAANTFALFSSLLFILSWQNKWAKAALLWSLLVSYSRIYLGVHYPADIFSGMMVGFLIAWVVNQLVTYINNLEI